MSTHKVAPGTYECRNTETGEVSWFVIRGNQSAYQYGRGNDVYGCDEPEALRRYWKWRTDNWDRMDILWKG